MAYVDGLVGKNLDAWRVVKWWSLKTYTSNGVFTALIGYYEDDDEAHAAATAIAGAQGAPEIRAVFLLTKDGVSGFELQETSTEKSDASEVVIRARAMAKLTVEERRVLGLEPLPIPPRNPTGVMAGNCLNCGETPILGSVFCGKHYTLSDGR